MANLKAVMAAVIILVSGSIKAQTNANTYSLTGIISDTSGQVLPGTTITIPDLRRGVIADSVGQYRLTNIPQGTFLVSVEHIGYHTEFKNIRFDQNIQQNFKLTIAVTEEKEIVITSSLQATTMNRNPIPIVGISKNFLNQNLSTNIVSAIANVPGVSAVSSGPNIAKPYIRGLGFNRVLTLFDGIRQEGQQWGDEHGIEIDQNDVERVEVIKGPASLLYGSDAIGGVINFIPPAEPPKGTQKGGASVNYQSNNNLLGVSANAAGRKNDLSWGVIGSHEMAANYKNKIDGRVYNTGFRQSSLLLQSSLHKKWGFTRIGASYFNDLQEIPDGKRDSASRKFEKEIGDDVFAIVPDKELNTYKISHIHQQIQHFRVYNISSIRLGNGRLGTQIGYQNNIRQEFDDPLTNDVALHMNLNTLTYDLKYFVPTFKDLNVTTGVNGMYQTNNSMKGNEFIIPNYRQFDLGPFVYARLAKDKSEWAGGIRYDIRHFKNEELFVAESGDQEIPVFGADTLNAEKLFSHYAHTFGGLSASLGFSHRFNSKWNIKINIARGYRAPNISELSANGIHSGAKLYQLGNQGFKPEFSLQTDASASFNSEHVSVDASIFNNTISNYIFNQKLLAVSGEDSVIVPGFETFQFTASRARLYGGELSIDIHPHPLDWLHFENTLSAVFAQNIGNDNQHISDDEKYLPFIVPVHGTSELRASFRNWNSLKNVYFKIQLQVYASQNRVFSLNNTETPTPGYQLFNIGAGADIPNKKGNTLFTVNLLADNIFNTAYQSHMSRLKYFEDYPDDPRGHSGIYEMGRNISLKLTVPFGF